MCKLKFFKTTTRTEMFTLRAEIKLSMSPEFCTLPMHQLYLYTFKQSSSLDFYQIQ